MATGWKKDYLRYKDFFLNVLSVYNTKPNLKIYLELIFSISTIIVFSVFAIRPTISTIIGLNKEIKAKEETLVKLKQKIKDLQTANNILQNESDSIQYVYQAVPRKSNPEILIKQVETLFKENSLQILGLSSSNIILLGKEGENKKSADSKIFVDDAGQLSFSLSATGSYQNIFLLLTKLEELRRPIKIDSFVLNSNVTDGVKILVLTITGRVPYII